MKELKAYLVENLDELKNLVWEVNGYNGSLGYLEVWENDEYTVNELLSSPYEALRSSYFGYYNFNDDLIKFNAYGNIESLNENDYEANLIYHIDDIIEELLKVYNKIDLSNELYELIENSLREV